MSAEGELTKIIDGFREIFGESVTKGQPFEMYAGRIKSLSIQAEAIIKRHFGFADQFTLHLWPATNVTLKGHLGRSVMEVASEAYHVIDAAINQMRREPLLGPQVNAPAKPLYVDGATIAALGELQHSRFDMSLLIQMCRELNVAHQNEATCSIILLVRAIMNHIPPVFGKATFEDVLASRTKSTKETLDRLQTFRKLADTVNHEVMRKAVTIPSQVAANASNAVEALMQEIVRELRQGQRPTM